MATVLVIIAWLLASWSLPAGSLIRPSQWSVSTPSISWEAIIHHRHHDHHPQKTHPSSTSTKTFNSANQLIIEEKLENAGEARGKAENVCSWVWLTRSGRHVGIDGIIATVLFISFNFFLSEVRHTSGGQFSTCGWNRNGKFWGINLKRNRLNWNWNWHFCIVTVINFECKLSYYSVAWLNITPNKPSV